MQCIIPRPNNNNKAGEDENWKKKTRDRGGGKRLSDEAVKKLWTTPLP